MPRRRHAAYALIANTAFWDKRARYPRFKARKRSNASAEYTRSAFRWRDGRLTPAKMSQPLPIVWSRPLPDGAEPSTVTVSRDPAGRWHVSILVEATVAPLPPASAQVGVDAGLSTLATLSTGEKVVNERHAERDRHRLARAQRVLVRKQSGAAHDRDVNAARNILAAGLAVTACGGDVRPTRHQPARQSPAKQETRPVRAGIPCLQL